MYKLYIKLPIKNSSECTNRPTCKTASTFKTSTDYETINNITNRYKRLMSSQVIQNIHKYFEKNIPWADSKILRCSHQYS